ncbi:MAG: MGH1-like glycoside hydrolase domain-containing protein [Ruthenibacterium lactatiformans]
MQYYAFFTGQAGGSTTADLQSGLLRPWDYFYNSGGWDDYPPQKAVHEQRLEKRCTPVVTTAHAVRCARILAYTAHLLAHGEDADRLEKDAERFTRALQEHAWDEGAGYFGYVLHDEQGRAAGFLRDASGVNHNMGLGGASPLFAGACTAEQAEGLWEKLASEEHLWSACGLSTVDRSAPYYRRDGYWNGAVWMPYQWMFFKAALDAGKTGFAFRIADTALRLWQDECAASYHCFEHL